MFFHSEHKQRFYSKTTQSFVQPAKISQEISWLSALDQADWMEQAF